MHRRLAEQFSRDGHEVGFFVMNGDPVPGWPTLPGAGSGSVAFAASCRRLRALIRQGVTHLVAAKEQANLCAWLASRGTGCRLICSRHATLECTDQRTSPRLLGLLYSLYLLGGGRAVAVSEPLARALAGRMLWRRERLHECPNAVVGHELHVLARQPAPCPLPEAFLLAVGRLVPEKGFDLLLEAYALASHQRPLPDLVIVGAGPQQPALRALAEGAGIASRVHFTGYLSNPYPLFCRARLFVLSSRHEGMPTALIEALALKVPVVATDCQTGPRQLLADGRLGVLVPPGDAQALAAGLLRGLREPLPVPDDAVRRFQGSQAAAAFYRVWNL